MAAAVRLTVELADMYVVLPALSFWSQTLRQDWERQGTPLADSFRYTSNANTQWLSVDQIREIVLPIEVDYKMVAGHEMVAGHGEGHLE